MTTPNPHRIAYVMSQYPAVSHIFIEREMLGLRRRGLDVHPFTVRPCPPEKLISASMRAEAARTQTLIGAPATTWLRAHVTTLLKHPGAWARGLGRALRRGAPHPKAKLWQAFYFAEAVVLASFLQRRGIDHVHSHMSNVAADVGRHAIALLRDIQGPESKAVWTLTVHGHGDFEDVVGYDLASKLRDADAVSAITDFCRSQLMCYSNPDRWDDIAVVPMSVDLTHYAPPQGGRQRATEDPVRLLFVGRLCPQKGGAVLIDTIRRLHDRGVPCEVRIIGAIDEYGQKMQSLATKHGLDEIITFMGPLGQDDLPGWYHWADVFVLPSFQEGLPVVIMEAMATELPVVSSAVMGIPELVQHRVTGMTTPPGRADLLAEVIAELAADPALRQRLGEAGRLAVEERHSQEHAAEVMERFMDAVRSGTPPRSINVGERELLSS